MATAVLALQGAFAEHERVLDRLGESWIELRGSDDLNHPFDRLILPGGESTVQGKLLRELRMLEPLRERILDGMPVLGTCAGLILLAEHIVDIGAAGRETIRPEHHFATLNVSVKRNAYGRQLGSFHSVAPASQLQRSAIPLTFIRAPGIIACAPEVQVLIELDGIPVAVRQNNQLACTFHPELDNDNSLHELFLSW